MTNAEIKAAAKAKLKGNLGTAIAAMLVFDIILFLLTMLPVIGQLGWLLIMGPVMLGMAGIYLGIVRDGKADLKLLFSGFSNFGNALVANILTGIFVFLWSLLFFIPGIVKLLAYSMTYYIMHDDPSVGGQEAITRSKEMMNGHKGELFALNLSFIGWYILCFFTFGIALLYVIPYQTTAVAMFYENLKKPGAAETPNVDYEPKPLEIEEDDGGVSSIPAGLNTSGNVSEATVVLNQNPANFGATTVLSRTRKTEGTFVGLSGGLAGQSYVFPDGMEIRIGRDAEQCNILTEDNNTSISRCHCVIQYRAQNDVFLLTDTSSNGVFMNGQRLDSGVEYEVACGSVISLGNGEETFRLE